MLNTYSRAVQDDGTIFMSEHFANPSRNVSLRLANGEVVTVSAATLNQEYDRQQADYAAETWTDENGVDRGPTGNRRTTSRIRKVDVSGLIPLGGREVRPAA
jgi:hypothetical protein